MVQRVKPPLRVPAFHIREPVQVLATVRETWLPANVSWEANNDGPSCHQFWVRVEAILEKKNLSGMKVI